MLELHNLAPKSTDRIQNYLCILMKYIILQATRTHELQIFCYITVGSLAVVIFFLLFLKFYNLPSVNQCCHVIFLHQVNNQPLCIYSSSDWLNENFHAELSAHEQRLPGVLRHPINCQGDKSECKWIAFCRYYTVNYISIYIYGRPFPFALSLNTHSLIPCLLPRCLWYAILRINWGLWSCAPFNSVFWQGGHSPGKTNMSTDTRLWHAHTQSRHSIL